jgi:hypothetical protein
MNAELRNRMRAATIRRIDALVSHPGLALWHHDGKDELVTIICSLNIEGREYFVVSDSGDGAPADEFERLLVQPRAR